MKPKNKTSINDIRDDLSFLKRYKGCEVVVFGSYANKNSDMRSDIDVAVITRERDRKRCMEVWNEILGVAPGKYDVKIFELLPLHVKASVIEKYEVVFGDRLDISEYFYHFRKLWNVAKHRIDENQFQNAEEKIRALEGYKNSFHGMKNGKEVDIDENF
ncbi:MAG: nucleotidyltransferase domain-containing protein [Halobacteriota archaeon]|nr:nucleotidyltransferase domain-containing protein [Halobacteriota archaeon]